LNIAEFRATALPTSCRPTISTAKDCRVGRSTAFRRPSRKAMTMTCQTATVCVSTRIDMVRLSSAAKPCVPSMVRRFGRASATSPPNSPSTRTGIHWTAATMPRSSGSPVSSRTSQLWATVIIHVPIRERPWPAKNSR